MVLAYEDFSRAFTAPAVCTPPQPNVAESALHIATGNWNDDRIVAALQGDHWHNNIRDLVASLVANGISDKVILTLAAGLTLPGFSVNQTSAEMQKMISGARQKGFDAHSQQEAYGDPLEGFHIVSAGELAAATFAPIEWLLEPLLPKPSLTMLAGPPKVGKSWLCLFFALQIANQGHEVFYLANEDNERRLQSRLRAVSLFPPDGIHFIAGLSADRPVPKGQAAHDFIRALKQRYPTMKCLIIDTLASVRSEPPAKSKKDDYTLSEEEFSSLRRLAHDLELAIILVHHTRKATDQTASPVETLLGSQGIAATVETIMVMKQSTGTADVELYVTGKDVEQQDLILPWVSPGFSWPQDMLETQLGSFQTMCLYYIRDNPNCLQKDLETDLGRDKSQVSRTVNELIKKRMIERGKDNRLVVI